MVHELANSGKCCWNPLQFIHNSNNIFCIWIIFVVDQIFFPNNPCESIYLYYFIYCIAWRARDHQIIYYEGANILKKTLTYKYKNILSFIIHYTQNKNLLYNRICINNRNCWCSIYHHIIPWYIIYVCYTIQLIWSLTKIVYILPATRATAFIHLQPLIYIVLFAFLIKNRCTPIVYIYTQNNNTDNIVCKI